ncbi:MAG TPA: DEAD/DEAH box helicase, partial [Ktedonobacterales bacterium]
MIADVLVPQGMWGGRKLRPIFSYLVPPALASLLQPGQLVAVPFGARLTQGIVWRIDTTGERLSSASPQRTTSADEPSEPRFGAEDGELTIDLEDDQAGPRDGVALREIASLLDETPVLLPHQQRLAEWVAEYYCASLATATLLMLPPGLGRGVRVVLGKGAERELTQAEGWETEEPLSDQSSRALAGLLRARGAVDEKLVRQAMGEARAGAAIAELVEAGMAELVPAHLRAQKARVVRLTVAAEEAVRWREETQQQLESLSPRQVLSVGRQLAVISLLLATSPKAAAGSAQAKHWTLTEVRKATKATPPVFEALERLGMIAIEDAEVQRAPVAASPVTASAALPLTSAQRVAVERIVAARDAPVFLLHGITGSGKTEVYLQALAAVIARGQRGIVLVPEIALTPQAMARFAGRFPGRVAVLHSGLSQSERYAEWRRIRAGQVDVVVGSRSAIFAPLSRLGLIVIDEEHEAAYKQEDRIPTYHAREVAITLGQLIGAPVVLGSATPSAESYYAAQSGRYVLLELPSRVGQGERLAAENGHSAVEREVRGAAESAETRFPQAPAAEGAAHDSGLPLVNIVDLRAELRAGHTNVLSRALIRALTEVLDARQQAILFLNRRGMASYVLCRECGYVACCPRCDIPLTFHAAEHALLCHYCYRQEPPPAICPVCLSGDMRYY